MMRIKKNKNKQIFYIQSIDPIIWLLLMIFIRPYYRIVCFQYRFVKEIGFKRLKVDTIPYHDFIECQKKAVKFSKENNFNNIFNNSIQIDKVKIDLTNQFAKKATNYLADLFVAVDILSQSEFKGKFSLDTGILNDLSVHDKIVEYFQTRTGLTYSENSGLKTMNNMLRFLFVLLFHTCKIFYSWIKSYANETDHFSNKILYYGLSPSHMNLDFNQNLSATFLFDNDSFNKEDIVFIGSDQTQSEKWRNEGYIIVDSFQEMLNSKMALKATYIYMKTIFSNRSLLYNNISFIETISKIYNIILIDVISSDLSIKGMIITISSIGKGPIEVLPFLSRNKPVVLYFYSSNMVILPYYSFLDCSHIFVWCKYTQDIIEEHPQTIDFQVYKVGPVIMGEDNIKDNVLQSAKIRYLPDSNTQSFVIGIFDIAPAHLWFLDNMRCPPVYTRSLHIKFMFDIFKLSEEIDDLSLLIKPKRWTPIHDIDISISDYISTHTEVIRLLPAQINPYLAIQMCDFIICTPYTSPLNAAYQKGIEGIFYAPKKQEAYYPLNSILSNFLIIGYDNLKEEICSAMRNGNINKNTKKSHLYFTGLDINKPVRDNFIGSLATVFGNE